MRELDTLGLGLSREIDRIMTDYVRSLRDEGIVPTGHTVTDTHLRDHAATLLTEIATALTVLGSLGDRSPALLRDGSELLRMIAELHGAQRYRLGWSEQELIRDTEVMAHEVLAALEKVSVSENERGSGYHYAVNLLHVLMARAAANSVRAYRAEAAAGAR